MFFIGSCCFCFSVVAAVCCLPQWADSMPAPPLQPCAPGIVPRISAVVLPLEVFPSLHTWTPPRVWAETTGTSGGSSTPVSLRPVLGLWEQSLWGPLTLSTWLQVPGWILPVKAKRVPAWGHWLPSYTYPQISLLWRCSDHSRQLTLSKIKNWPSLVPKFVL